MDNEKMVIITTRKELREEFYNAIESKSKENKALDFEEDRLTQTQASKLAGISIPTLKKEIRAGRFNEYKLGRKRYLLKSELIQSLRNSTL